MKAKDLMIGDWVCVTKNFAQKYHRIRALSNDKEDVLKGTYTNNYGVECNSIFSLNDIEPISLTPEILEKNGFERKLDNDNIHYRFTLTYEHTMFSLLYVRSVFQWYYPIDFKYVHELQHALKLCGIDKEIKL